MTNEELKAIETFDSETRKFSIKDAIDELKEKKHDLECDDETMEAFYEICLSKFSMYKLTGQKRAARKVLAFAKIVAQERELVKAGINKFVYAKDIRDFMDYVKENDAKDNILFWDIEDYERDIPCDVINKIKNLSEIFDGFKILFTDYTGKENKKLEKEKDPILFGYLKHNRDTLRSDYERYYFIADWTDEFCDLTFDKMIDIMSKEYSRDGISHEFTTPDTKKEFNEELAKLTLAIDPSGLRTSVVYNPEWSSGYITSTSTFTSPMVVVNGDSDLV